MIWLYILDLQWRISFQSSLCYRPNLQAAGPSQNPSGKLSEVWKITGCPLHETDDFRMVTFQQEHVNQNLARSYLFGSDNV